MASTATRLRIKDYKKCRSQKFGYRTKDEAWTAAERSMDKGLVDAGCHLMPYACPECGDWHVANRVIVKVL